MNIRTRAACIAAAFSALGAFAAVLHRANPSVAHDDMAAAAAKLVESFPEADRAKLRLPFDDKAREDWHFVPRSRPGMRLADMNEARRPRRGTSSVRR